jgi:methionyl-tRNA formyltransferase
MGTPEFAVPSLKILLDNDYEIKAVVTAVDKPAGRGRNIISSDIKKFALENNLLILQPEKLKDINFINTLKELNADLFIVVAFRMLPKEVWQLPRLGTFNLHSSLLPDYRGAAPINHAIINGEKVTGVTTFFINENIDTGNIILQQKCEISHDDNAGTLHDKLKNLGAELLLRTVKNIEKGNIKTLEQNNLNNPDLKYASKIDKEFCRINWTDKPKKIHNLIRGLSPYPSAFTVLKDDENNIIKIYQAYFTEGSHEYETGKVISDNKTFIKVAIPEGYIYIDELQMSGKKRLTTKDFLNGYNFKENTYFI